VLWTEAAFSACLAWQWPDHHWQWNWQEAWTSSRMCTGKRRTLRATIGCVFNYCDNFKPYDKKHFCFGKCDTIFKSLFWKLPKFYISNFHKVVWQHTDGMVGSLVWVLLEIYLAFSSWRILKIHWELTKLSPASLNFSTLGSFKRSIRPTDVDFSNFLKYA